MSFFQNLFSLKTSGGTELSKYSHLVPHDYMAQHMKILFHRKKMSYSDYVHKFGLVNILIICFMIFILAFLYFRYKQKQNKKII